MKRERLKTRGRGGVTATRVIEPRSRDEEPRGSEQRETDEKRYTAAGTRRTEAEKRV